ncbi:cellulose biosynthesis cyclic di-GMP-binding regulatory protein BcsB [Solibacillus silvestris]|uniref:cellulose biosynthesis cyclic di-GMP-binding regulatory protein BcsB n=1 Tax=Solibacillus silvestris TaxID=76853 RepID=UPI003F80018D
MKHLLSVLFGFIAFLVFQTTVLAVEVKLPIEGVSETTRSPLFTEEVTLEGESGEVEFVYELLETQQAEGQKLQLYFNHSQLLIAPSSLTVAIDGVAVQSIGLDRKQTELAVILPSNALKEGSHTISIKYAGILKEGICVEQNTSGNWLTLEIASFIDIHATVHGQLRDLNQYPAYFVGTDTRNTQIIVPDEPTLKTLNAALQLTNYLSSSSAYNKVKLLKESQVKMITHATVIIGQENQFKNAWLNELIDKGKADDGLSLSIQPITVKQSASKNVLVITGKDDAEFEKIGVLTEDSFVKQLQGSRLTVTNMPVSQENTDRNKIAFKTMGIPSMTLGYGKTSSDTYYYYMPYYPFSDMKASIQLHLKISETIQSSQSEKNNPSEELVLLVNEVPHSIDLREVKRDKNGDIFVEVPLSSSVFTQSTLMRIQLAANGLHEKTQCIQSDQAKWVYIDEASAINFNVDKQTVAEFNFRFFPFPNSDESVMVVVPEQYRWSDLLAVYEALTINNKLPTITLVQSGKVTEADLKNGHVLFIGGKKQHKQLQDEVLVVHYNDNIPDLTEHGFFNVSQFAFIQNNPWNEDFALVVLDAIGDADQYAPKEFMTSLKLLGENAKIAVNGNAGKVFTNEAEVTEKNFSQAFTSNMLDSNSFYLFFILFFIVIAMIIYVWRKKKKK